jgi:hypothetical protein
MAALGAVASVAASAHAQLAPNAHATQPWRTKDIRLWFMHVSFDS